jgi:tryptophan synthase alpha chain
VNRIDKKFRELKKQKRAALIIYITVGYPSLSKTKELVFELERCGADIIELGIPFSDPLADGPTIQAASYHALKNKVCLKDAIRLVKEIRRRSDVPIAFMTYYNPVYHFGAQRFVKEASRAGVDGVIVPDLPPEEAGLLIKSAKKAVFSTIFLLAPTSTARRIRLVSKASTGFVYYVSLTGITGARKRLERGIANEIARIKRFTDKPVAVGFGVSNPAQAGHIAKLADGVIVGSAVIKVIGGNLNKTDTVKKTGRFVKGLANAAHKA